MKAKNFIYIEPMSSFFLVLLIAWQLDQANRPSVYNFTDTKWEAETRKMGWLGALKLYKKATVKNLIIWNQI